MNTQKNAAWYRHQSWHRQTIIPALMPCSNGAWRFLPLPDRAKHKQSDRRLGISSLAVLPHHPPYGSRSGRLLITPLGFTYKHPQGRPIL